MGGDISKGTETGAQQPVRGEEGGIKRRHRVISVRRHLRSRVSRILSRTPLGNRSASRHVSTCLATGEHLKQSGMGPTLASTILKIFWTLILALVLEKIRLACIALANRFACFVISSCSSLGNVEKLSNLVPTRNGIAVCL
jgi:hypothetical protein